MDHRDRSQSLLSTRSRVTSPPTSRPAQLPSDHELVLRMAEGDTVALAMLFDRWSAHLHGLALLLLNDPEEAEEALEDTFWQAWREAARFDSLRSPVSAWLRMILRSRALDRVRAIRRTRPVEHLSLHPMSSSLVASAPDPSENAEGQERRAMVLRALAELGAEQREAVELAYYRGMSQSEIAVFTGVPLGTVKTRLRLAMLKLRDHLRVLHDRSG